MVEKTKKILVTGAQGKLGGALCGILAPFYEVICIDAKDCDITDKKAVEKFFKDLFIDAVVHCAAYTDVDKAEDEPERAFSINAEGTKNILNNLKNKNCLFVYISTDYVFDGKKKQAYTENDEPNPLGAYGHSKLEGEKIVENFVSHVILRTSWLFGPGGKNFVATILRLANEKKTIEMVKDEVGSPTYTLDLAKAVKVLLDIYFKKGLDYGVYNVTNSGKCSRLEFAEYITKSADLKTVFIPIVSSQSTRKAKRPQNSLLSNDKFISLTSHRLPSWQEAVRHYLEHSKNE